MESMKLPNMPRLIGSGCYRIEEEGLLEQRWSVLPGRNGRPRPDQGQVLVMVRSTLSPETGYDDNNVYAAWMRAREWAAFQGYTSLINRTARDAYSIEEYAVNIDEDGAVLVYPSVITAPPAG